MAQDVTSQFYHCLNLPLQEKLRELTRIIDFSPPNKELQAIFPQLVSSVFTSSFTGGWGLRTVTNNRHDFEMLISFFEPQGPMFRLCYKLLSDPHLKFNLPLNLLPQDLQLTLERGICPQFYADMINMDAQAISIVALALNPFDYYMFNFALHLISSNCNKSSWENWNTVYFALACDYLVHFLPSDPNVPVLPLISNYTGKVPMVAPLQTANRPMYSPSLLRISDMSGVSNQHVTSQTQSRNEVWRSETVLQVFIDIWLSVEEFNPRNVDTYQRRFAMASSSPERVRAVRVLIKQIHAYSAKQLSDPAARSAELRTYARHATCPRAYRYVRHLVATWPLDASFRLVMELWLSLIQPWRYTDNTSIQDRAPASNNNQEEGNSGTVDASSAQFIAENFPSYTCIFSLVLPRFLRLDLTTAKNAVMLFRLGKVFSQPYLVQILRDLEHAITENNNGLYYTPDASFHNSSIDQSQSFNYSTSTNKWATVAKQAISEYNLSSNFQYEPIWSDNKRGTALEFLKKIVAAKAIADQMVQESNTGINQQNLGVWATIKEWLMIDEKSHHERILLEECKKVPTYLDASIHYFSHIFGLNENSLTSTDPIVNESILDQSSFTDASRFLLSITSKLRSKATDISYMGDPDLMPIASYESTILVRILYQIASRINEMYRDEFTNIYNRTDFWGNVGREVLQPPCTVHSYVRDAASHQSVLSARLPPRLSLRRLGSHACVVYLSLGYVLFKLLSYSGFTYLFFVFSMFVLYCMSKATLKSLKIVN